MASSSARTITQKSSIWEVSKAQSTSLCNQERTWSTNWNKAKIAHLWTHSSFTISSMIRSSIARCAVLFQHAMRQPRIRKGPSMRSSSHASPIEHSYSSTQHQSLTIGVRTSKGEVSPHLTTIRYLTVQLTSLWPSQKGLIQTHLSISKKSKGKLPLLKPKNTQLRQASIWLRNAVLWMLISKKMLTSATYPDRLPCKITESSVRLRSRSI